MNQALRAKNAFVNLRVLRGFVVKLNLKAHRRISPIHQSRL